MNTADVMVGKLKARGIALEVHGDKLRWSPLDALSPEEVAELRQHKTELMAVLRHNDQTAERCELSPVSRFAFDGEHKNPNEAELGYVAAKLVKDGYCLLWSNIVQDLVAFYMTEADRVKVPPGFVQYSDNELSELFGDGKKSPSREHIWLIHEAKKLGNCRVIGFETKGEQA